MADVGEGQEEPNKEPFLATPTVGRGIGDFLKGTMGEGLGGNLLLYVKIFLGIFIVVVVIMILFIKPGILVNWKDIALLNWVKKFIKKNFLKKIY